jgi:hypothetical protein
MVSKVLEELALSNFRIDVCQQVDYIGMVVSPGYKMPGLARPKVGKKEVEPEQARSLKSKLKKIPYEAMGTGNPLSFFLSVNERFPHVLGRNHLPGIKHSGQPIILSTGFSMLMTHS